MAWELKCKNYTTTYCRHRQQISSSWVYAALYAKIQLLILRTWDLFHFFLFWKLFLWTQTSMISRSSSIISNAGSKINISLRSSYKQFPLCILWIIRFKNMELNFILSLYLKYAYNDTSVYNDTFPFKIL